MNDSSSLPIGLFDSGMGGLTVLKALSQRLPEEDLLYLGDTARLPYGTKGRDTIIRYTLKAAAKLVEMGVKMLVVACNTATSAALPTLRERFAPLPVLGVVEPGAQAAIAASANKCIAVIATEATIAGRAYQETITRLCPEARVVGRACTLFVPLAEEGWMAGPLVEAIAHRYLEDILPMNDSAAISGSASPNQSPDQNPDTLLLGCTHFPLLQNALRNVLAPGVQIVDSAATTADCVAKTLRSLDMLRTGPGGRYSFLTTDNPARFARTGSLFLGEHLDGAQVTLVDL